MVYRFDRFARSTRHLVNALDEFRALGVQFISVHEAIDTTTPMGRLAFQIFAAIAEFERELIRERVRSGMAEAKAKGKHVGRPSRNLEQATIRQMRALGATWQAVAEALGVGESTCRKFMARQAEKGCAKPPELATDSKGFAVPVDNRLETVQKKTL